jgi:flagellar biosynthesis protein FliQ
MPHILVILVVYRYITSNIYNLIYKYTKYLIKNIKIPIEYSKIHL